MKYRIVLEMKKTQTYSMTVSQRPFLDDYGILVVVRENGEVWHIREWVAWVDLKEESDK